MKYEFTGETKDEFGVTLRRIRATVAFGVVAKAEIGGWIGSDKNLAHDGNAWVYGNARVFGNAWVYGNARVYGRIIVATRSDGYTFLVTPCADERVRIIAGCRYFTFTEAVAHWKKTRKGTRLGKESLLIVAHLKAMAKLQGWKL